MVASYLEVPMTEVLVGLLVFTWLYWAIDRARGA